MVVVVAGAEILGTSILITEASSRKAEDLLPAEESDEALFIAGGGADTVEASHDAWRGLG